MGTKENAGCAIAGTAYVILSILGVLIHVWTIIIAFMLKGFLAALISFIFPVVSQIYWFFKIGSNVGFTNNWFCISIIAYVGLWLIVFIGGAIASTDKS